MSTYCNKNKQESLNRARAYPPPLKKLSVFTRLTNWNDDRELKYLPKDSFVEPSLKLSMLA